VLRVHLRSPTQSPSAGRLQADEFDWLDELEGVMTDGLRDMGSFYKKLAATRRVRVCNLRDQLVDVV
jgi:hypothetical protein